jgi:hypothetical protein
MTPDPVRPRPIEPIPVLIDGCIPGWLVLQLNPHEAHVRNAISGQLEKLHMERVTPRELELPAHFQMDQPVGGAPR